MDELLSFGQKVLQQQPFSQFLGAELAAFTRGIVEMRLPVRSELKQQHGFVHGGVLSYLADNALTFAGGSVLGDSVTAEYKINYLRPALGALLIARASVISAGKKQAVCECKLYCEGEQGEKLVAVAQGTISKVE